MVTGAWPAFVEIMFVWNREYAAYDVTNGQYWLCALGIAVRFFPWMLVHFVAVPIAASQIWQAANGFDLLAGPSQLKATASRALFAGFYVGWLIQSIFLQHSFDYVNTPPVLLGLTVVACWAVASKQMASRRLALGFFLVCVIARFPALCYDRAAVWWDCVREGSTPALRDRLSLSSKVSWSDLELVKDYLRGRNLKDGELSSMHMNIISLYGELNVRPATRFYSVLPFVVILPNQRRIIDEELANCHQRFMVCDIEGFGMEKLRDALKEDPSKSPVGGALWSNPIVFRSGRYVVLQLSGPETSRWLDGLGRR
jgi:hypothetical protein